MVSTVGKTKTIIGNYFGKIFAGKRKLNEFVMYETLNEKVNLSINALYFGE